MTAKEKILVLEEPSDSCSFIVGVDCPLNSGELSSINFLPLNEPFIFYEINKNTAGNTTVQILGSKLSKDLKDMDSGQHNKLLME